MTELRTDIQGLRAVAVLLVIAYHAEAFGASGGFIGVDVFFVISGFVIGSSLFRELGRSDSVSLTKFYARRIRRLVPAFAAMTITVLAASVLLLEIGAVQQTAAKSALAAAFSVSNLYFYFVGDAYFATDQQLNPFLHTWSLGVEEQFYVIAPVIFALLAWLARFTRWSRRHLVVAGLAAATTLSLLASMSAVSGGEVRWAFYAPHLRLWEIGCGMILAAVPSVRIRWASVPVVAGLAMIVTSTLRFDEFTPFPGRAALLPVVATLLLIVAGEQCGWWRRLSGAGAMQWMGDRSYGWYLWHWPFIVFARAWVGDHPGLLLLAAVLSLGPTALSYRYVEQPIRGDIRIRGGQLAVMYSLTLVVLLALSTTVSFGARRSWGLDVTALERDNLSHVNGCHGQPDDACVFVPESGRSSGTVLFVGDSHAAALSDGVVTAANELGWTVVAASESLCSFMEVETFPHCEGFRRTAWDLIDEHRPDLVLVAHESAGYMSFAGTAEPRIRTREGTPARDRDDALRLWQRGLAQARDDLESNGIALVSIDVVPLLPEDLDHVPTVVSPSRGAVTVSLSELADYRSDVVAAEHEVLDAGHHFDVAPTLCATGECSSVSPDGEWLYYDRRHLNRAGGLLVVDRIEAELRRVAGVLEIPVHESSTT